MPSSKDTASRSFRKFSEGRIFSNLILNVLQNLLDTYNQQGEAAFVGLLADSGKLGPGNASMTVHGLHHFMEKNGVAATIDRIAARVFAALTALSGAITRIHP